MTVLRLLYLALALGAFLTCSAQTVNSSKNPSIYNQLDPNQPDAPKPQAHNSAPINYDKEIARLSALLAQERAKTNPDQGQIVKLTYHINDMKTKQAASPLKLKPLQSK